MQKKTEVNKLSVVVMRICLSGIFLVAGLNHFLKTEKTVARLEKAKLANLSAWIASPENLVLLSGGIMLIAGTSLLIGYKTKWAALILMLVLIPITITIQVGQASTLGPLFKNIAIFGGLIFFIINPLTQKQT